MSPILFTALLSLPFCCAAPFMQDVNVWKSKSAFREHVTESGKNKGTMIMRADDWQPEWCKARAFNQTVHHAGCLQREIPNKYCYGQCNSIYIPDQRSPLQGCAACRPKSSTWITVKLRCPLDPLRKVRHRKIEIIHSCQCEQTNCV